MKTYGLFFFLLLLDRDREERLEKLRLYASRYHFNFAQDGTGFFKPCARINSAFNFFFLFRFLLKKIFNAFILMNANSLCYSLSFHFPPVFFLFMFIYLSLSCIFIAAKRCRLCQRSRLLTVQHLLQIQKDVEYEFGI